MSLEELVAWIEVHSTSSGLWFLKRLSANDTLANDAHQAGPYIPKQLLFEAFPTLYRRDVLNPDARFEAFIDSHNDQRTARAIWYNNRLFGKTRNEARITNWGGASSPLLDPENTGSVAIFAFGRPVDGQPGDLHVWVCRNTQEENLIEDRLGPIEPGVQALWRPSTGTVSRRSDPIAVDGLPCRLEPEQIPRSWLERFPTGAEIVAETLKRRAASGRCADERLMLRRACEYELFLSLEEAIEGPKIAKGFSSIEAFVEHAQSILQRRKSRSGRSLELHTAAIFSEERLVEGIHYSSQPESDAGKRPDFLFPSETAYKDPAFPRERLRMLATKTTCKDRWRQIISEADRIPVKHLLTLQEGVSAPQLAEMSAAGVRLIVPEPLMSKYPSSVRDNLISLSAFLDELRSL